MITWSGTQKQPTSFHARMHLQEEIGRANDVAARYASHDPLQAVRQLRAEEARARAPPPSMISHWPSPHLWLLCDGLPTFSCFACSHSSPSPSPPQEERAQALQRERDNQLATLRAQIGAMLSDFRQDYGAQAADYEQRIRAMQAQVATRQTEE